MVSAALPRGDFVAPIVFGAIYGFSWWMAGEGNIKALAEKVEINTDPTQNPTPTQLFHHIWPYVAGSLGTLFDSVACRFSQTGDMDWLCNVALNDDTNAAVALSVLTPPAENSPAFLRAILERAGAFRRVKEIVQIYKTLPREQHDDVSSRQQRTTRRPTARTARAWLPGALVCRRRCTDLAA